jgi:hypothetical protein
MANVAGKSNGNAKIAIGGDRILPDPKLQVAALVVV